MAAAGALALGGCAYGDYGYSGVGLGYGDGYDSSYHPGTGIYVYDSYRRQHVWSDHQRTYWTSRRQAAATTSHTRDVEGELEWLQSADHVKQPSALLPHAPIRLQSAGRRRISTIDVKVITV